MLHVICFMLHASCFMSYDEGMTKKELLDSYAKGVKFLFERQNEEGAFVKVVFDKKIPSVAYTALCLNAIMDYGSALSTKETLERKKRAAEYLIDNQNEDGSFSEKGGFFKTYCTSLVIQALNGFDPEAYKEHVYRGKRYLVVSQVKEGIFEGGFGYKQLEPAPGGVKESDLADLSNTGFAAEALKEVGWEDNAVWKRLIKFVQRCQNTTEAERDEEWMEYLESNGYQVGNDGGAFYAPVADERGSKAGTTKGEQEKLINNSYASMTYEALKTYIYAGLTKDDPRVNAAYNWIRDHFTLDRHPGFPFDSELPEGKRRSEQGLYYYYFVVAKALDAYGDKILKTSDGAEINWAQKLAEKLVNLQNQNGSWMNKNPRWWENDPVLVTSYALTAYQALLGYLR